MVFPASDQVPDAESGETDEQMRAMLLGLVSGNNSAYAEFWRLYGERLRAVAHSRLPLLLQNRLEAADVVQSACRSFFRRATGGELKLSDSESLWRLLCAMTLNKARMQIRFHSRKRRSPKRELPLESPGEESSGFDGIQPAAAAASPAEMVIFTDQLELLMSSLDAEERQMVELKLQDYSSAEIASQLGCSDRTVRRLLQRIRDRWQSVLYASLDGEQTS